MKIFKIIVLSILVATPIFLSSCQNPSGGVDFVGVWRADLGGGEIATVTFTTTTIHISDTTNGTVDYSITSYDENAKHILTSVTGSTGAWTAQAGANGTVSYWLYSINANQIDFAIQTGSYPASVSGIVFVKL